jgi:hypothetical protein
MPFKSYCRFRFYGRHLGCPVEGEERSDFIGDGTIEKPVPKMGG